MLSFSSPNMITSLSRRVVNTASTMIASRTRRVITASVCLTVPLLIANSKTSIVDSICSVLSQCTVAHAASSPPNKGPSGDAFDEAENVVLDNSFLPFRSQPSIPAHLSHALKEVVGESFESSVLDPNVDVIVEYYSPNCVACKQFSIVLETLAEAFADVPQIRIAKMNAYDNYVPGVLTAGEEDVFPTLKLFPAGQLKLQQHKSAVSDVDRVTTYNRSVLEQQRMDREANSTAGLVSADTLQHSRRHLSGVGLGLPLSGTTSSSDAKYSWDAVVDSIHAHATHKFDKTAVLTRLHQLVPDMKQRIAAEASKYIAAGDKVSRLAPCGQEWTDLSNSLLMRGIGGSLNTDISKAKSAYMRCLNRKKNDEMQFWSQLNMYGQMVKQMIDDEENNANEEMPVSDK